MINCAEQLISEYVDGDLAPATALELEHHLWTCAHCRALLLDYRALIAATHLLARLGQPAPEKPGERDQASHARGRRIVS
jgi:anti-sigma factor RsiW